MISMFAKKSEVVAVLPAPAPVPDFDKARTLIGVSIDKLRSRANFLQANIERDSAELRETNRTLEALVEAKAKVAPADIEVDEAALDAELDCFLPQRQAAE